MNKPNKFLYIKVVQQHYGGQYGWEDVEEYDTAEYGWRIQWKAELADYRLMGYPTRSVTRRMPNPEWEEWMEWYNGAFGKPHSVQEYKGFWILETGSGQDYGFRIYNPNYKYCYTFSTLEWAKQDIELGIHELHD